MSRLPLSLFDWHRSAGNRRLFLFCLLLFVISAFLSFWAFFPADVLQRRLVQEVSRQTGIKMRGENATMLFPVGLKLDLSIYSNIPELADFNLTGLQVSPVWTSLFSNNPAVQLKGELAGGQLVAEASRNGNVELRVENLAVAALQQPDIAYRVSGRLTGQVNGKDLSENMNGQGDFSLQLQNTKIQGLGKIGLPGDFSVGLLQVEGQLNQRRLSFEKIVASEGMLEFGGGGTLLIGTTPDRTRLNLNVRLHQTQSTPASLRELLQLTGIRPTADGSYLLRIGGTLARPVVR